MAIAHSNLGESLIKMGQLEDAEKHFRASLALEPNHTLTKFRLASVAIKMDHPTNEMLHEADAL